MTEEEKEDIVLAFYRSVLEFYCVFVDALMKKFPFKSSLLVDLMVLIHQRGQICIKSVTDALFYSHADPSFFDWRYVYMGIIHFIVRVPT